LGRVRNVGTTLSIEDVCDMSLIGSRFIYNDHKSN